MGRVDYATIAIYRTCRIKFWLAHICCVLYIVQHTESKTTRVAHFSETISSTHTRTRACACSSFWGSQLLVTSSVEHDPGSISTAPTPFISGQDHKVPKVSHSGGADDNDGVQDGCMCCHSYRDTLLKCNSWTCQRKWERGLEWSKRGGDWLSMLSALCKCVFVLFILFTSSCHPVNHPMHNSVRNWEPLVLVALKQLKHELFEHFHQNTLCLRGVLEVPLGSVMSQDSCSLNHISTSVISWLHWIVAPDPVRTQPHPFRTAGADNEHHSLMERWVWLT